MDKNIKLKAYCDNIDRAEQKCISIEAQLIYSGLQTDTSVSKERKTYRFSHDVVINLDKIKGLGDFIEIEGAIEKETCRIIENLIKTFDISFPEMIPWSYGEMVKMYENSHLYRIKLHKTKKTGTLFLLDGASCSGKTTILHDLGCEELIEILPRYCTREPRKNIRTESEYVFVSKDKFRTLASSGAFIEYRDYLFGMSYGIPWKETFDYLLSGKNLLGIINLGNVLHVRKIFPEAVLILIDAPVRTIKKRLNERGFNKKEQIEERLENAGRVESCKKYYDCIINNDDDMLKKSEEKIKKIIMKKSG
ncbi:MAG: hypothetical protein M1501_00380 [Candidatus Omnitrophica bacterium]|nr:hypothetical protein [Candidatus Omnitrophota bacterium]